MTHEIKVGQHGQGCECPHCRNTHYYKEVKEPPFVPEYFSGLNWREALEKGLVGKEVEYSMDGENWKGPDYLYKVNPTITSHRYVCGDENHVYIRTTPKTYGEPA